MSNQYPPPGAQYAPPPQQTQYQQPQQQYQPIQPAQPQQSGWVDNRQVIGGWSAQQHGQTPGKYVEYKVFSKPTNKGGTFKTVEFFRPFQKKDGQWVNGREFNFNQMRDLVDKINHFVNTYGSEKGYFVWQPAETMQGVGQSPGYPQQQQMYPAQQPQYAPPQQVYGAPNPQAYGTPQDQSQQQYAPQPAPGRVPWP